MTDKAIRAAKLTAAGLLDKARARTAVTRAGGQIAPSKYLPNVPRQVHADGGKVGFLAGNHPLVPAVLYLGSAAKIATKGWTSEIDPEQTQRNIDAQDFRDFRPSEYARAGWNGKGMWLRLIEQYQVGYDPHILGLKLLPWIGMKTADGAFVPWLASQTDMLAEDWGLVG